MMVFVIMMKFLDAQTLMHNFDASLGCTDDDGSCFYSDITIEYSTILTSCEIECDGIIDITIDNGQPPYIVQYTFVEDGATIITGNDLVNACYGYYTVMISDAYNCEYETTILVDYESGNHDDDDDGICENDEIEGCQNSEACNYDPDATNDGECIYPDEAYLDCNNSCLNDTDNDGICNELEIEGCQDSEACNYNPDATDACEDVDNDGVPDCCTLCYLDDCNNYPINYFDCDGTLYK